MLITAHFKSKNTKYTLKCINTKSRKPFCIIAEANIHCISNLWASANQHQGGETAAPGLAAFQCPTLHFLSNILDDLNEKPVGGTI